MPRGRTRQSAWDRCVADLAARRNRYRMVQRSRSPWVYVREYDSGQVLRTFSTGTYRYDDDADVEACYQRCLLSHSVGRWQDPDGPLVAEAIDWPRFARRVLESVRERIPKVASRAHAEGHLRTIARFSGPVCAVRLERWARECDPIAQAHPFRKRLETLAQVHASGLLNMSDTLARLRALRPRGSARKRQEQRTQRPRAIPSDRALQDWLDQLSGVERWVFALIATYGLRPSEAWHAEEIDAQGWLTVPGDGLTKTARHYAPPVPAAWVARYQLADRFSQYQEKLLERWPLKWEERDGIRVPINNSAVSNYLYKLQRDRAQPGGGIYPAQVAPLVAPAAEGGGTDWVRPYDLRHSYAVRCFTDPQVNGLPTEDHAAWMGHGADVHERIYLRWMPASRQKLALQERHTRLGPGAPQERQEGPSAPRRAESDTTGAPEASLEPQGLPADVVEKLAKLEQLERLLLGR